MSMAKKVNWSCLQSCTVLDSEESTAKETVEDLYDDSDDGDSDDDSESDDSESGNGLAHVGLGDDSSTASQDDKSSMASQEGTVLSTACSQYSFLADACSRLHPHGIPLPTGFVTSTLQSEKEICEQAVDPKVMFKSKPVCSSQSPSYSFFI